MIWVASVQANNMQYMQLSTLVPLASSPSSQMPQALISDSSIEHGHGSEVMVPCTIAAAADTMGLDVDLSCTTVPVISGIPQGSILVSILFASCRLSLF